MIELHPKCVLIPEATRYRKKAVRIIRFDEPDLIIEVQGEGFSYARIVFRDVIGFRVMDEREITEFWNEYSEPNGWLWEVLDGGWLSLEKNRKDFNLLNLPTREFFVVDEFCVNIWCLNEPEIIDLGVDPSSTA